MTPGAESRQHLAKAREFLEAAATALDAGHTNAACSLAVTSAIQSKDAICCALLGATAKSGNHEDAVLQLRRALPREPAIATALGKVLGSKAKSQYASNSVSTTDAQNAVKRARSIFERAREIVTS